MLSVVTPSAGQLFVPTGGHTLRSLPGVEVIVETIPPALQRAGLPTGPDPLPDPHTEPLSPQEESTFGADPIAQPLPTVQQRFVGDFDHLLAAGVVP